MKKTAISLATLAALSSAAFASEGRHYDLDGSDETMGSFTVRATPTMKLMALAVKPLTVAKVKGSFLTAIDELHDSRGFRR